MEDNFKGIVDKSVSILVLLPLKPTFDEVASGLSLYLTLREFKDIQVYSPSPMIVEFNRLVGINKIVTELGNKNLIIQFENYKANDIERVSYDIKDGQFKLTVIPKQKVSPPGKESVSLSYSGINSDTVLMIGGSNDSDFPAVTGSELANANIIHIGVNDKNLVPGKNYISFSRPASSVSEVVFGLINRIGSDVDEDVATNLIMGIESSTNYFTELNTSAETFQTVSDLMKLGGKRSAKPFPGSFPPPLKNRPQTPFGGQVFSQNKNKQSGGSTPSDWLEPKIYKGTSVS